jgi:predicted dehydrogenase
MSLGTTGVDEQSSYQLGFAGGALADMVAGLAVRGSNDFVITGERGSLRLDEPFYCAHRIETRSYAAPAMAQPGPVQSEGLARKVLRGLRNAPAAKLLWRRISPLAKGLRRGRSRSFAFAGNGYQFELMEVNRCLRDDRTESATMPMDDSLAVMKTMDALRSQYGLVYPQECAELQNS